METRQEKINDQNLAGFASQIIELFDRFYEHLSESQKLRLTGLREIIQRSALLVSASNATNSSVKAFEEIRAAYSELSWRAGYW